MNRFKRAPATATLLAAIGIMALLQLATGGWEMGTLTLRGANRPWGFLQYSGQYDRLLISIFLHGGIVHLLMNVFGLYQVGTIYELMFGTRRFLFIYFVAGIGASLTSTMLMAPHGAALGASGALFGILGALIFSILRSPRFRHDRGARSLVVQCVFVAGLNIAIGMQVPEVIDNAAHIGGFVCGLLLGAILPHRTPPPPPQTVIDVTPYENDLQPPPR